MNKELSKKIKRAIRLIESAGFNEEVVEVAYSGGKDSDVILELTRMSGINYRAIYKNTTIDVPGTISHVIERGAEIIRPEESFFQLMARSGFPTRKRRFCCSVLKEYKVLDRVIVGVRKSESSARNKRYNEPEICRIYSKSEPSKNARHYYPLLDWTNEDVSIFLNERKIKCASVYYDNAGQFHPERRLGCLCCPMMYYKKRIEEFKKYPKMVRAYIRAAHVYENSHPDSHLFVIYKDVYEWFTSDLFCSSPYEFEERFRNQLFFEKIDCKEFLQNYFNVDLSF